MVDSSPAAQHSGIHAKGGRGWVGSTALLLIFLPYTQYKKKIFFKNALLFKVKHYSAELCTTGLGCVWLPRGLIGANRARSAIGGSFRITHLLAFCSFVIADIYISTSMETFEHRKYILLCDMTSLDPAETLNSTSLS